MGGADQNVSVVMPVRNAMPFLDEAVASILAQTHGKFEFVIGDDGSTDGSGERLDQWARADPRIRLIRNSGTGLGPAGSSNWVVSASRHPLIARMDADDISKPDRLRRQLSALRDDPDAIVVGSLFEVIDEAGRLVRKRDRSALRAVRGDYPAAHGSIMFRREAFDRVGGYRAQCDFWEDCDLLLRLTRQGRALVLPEALYRYRLSRTSCRLVADEARVARALDLCARCLASYWDGRDYDPLIEREGGLDFGEAVAPSVLAQIASMHLWRGDPRAILRSWAGRHTALSWNRQAVLIRIFAAWAWVSPTSLRTCLILRSRYADWRARRVVADGDVHIWKCDVPPARVCAPRSGSDNPKAAIEERLMAAGVATQHSG